jgi:hypothetical protein
MIHLQIKNNILKYFIRSILSLIIEDFLNMVIKYRYTENICFIELEKT